MQGEALEAVVDTGAEVSVLDTRIFDRLVSKPRVKQQVTIVQAGKKGFIAVLMEIRLRDRTYHAELYVAPLQDPMLLGMEFLACLLKGMRQFP